MVNCLVSGVELVSEECMSAQQSCKERQQECLDLRDSISNLQELIHKRCDIEDENQKLKDVIMAKEQENENLTKQHQDEVERLRDDIKKQQLDHYSEIEKVKESSKAKLVEKEQQLKEMAITDKCSFEMILQEKNEELSEIRNKMDESDMRYSI